MVSKVEEAAVYCVQEFLDGHAVRDIAKELSIKTTEVERFIRRALQTAIADALEAGQD